MKIHNLAYAAAIISVAAFVTPANATIISGAFSGYINSAYNYSYPDGGINITEFGLSLDALQGQKITGSFSFNSTEFTNSTLNGGTVLSAKSSSASSLIVDVTVNNVVKRFNSETAEIDVYERDQVFCSPGPCTGFVLASSADAGSISFAKLQDDSSAVLATNMADIGSVNFANLSGSYGIDLAFMSLADGTEIRWVADSISAVPISPTPLPGALSLFGSTLAGLTGIGLRNKAIGRRLAA
jgi:hypothetical protein